MLPFLQVFSCTVVVIFHVYVYVLLSSWMFLAIHFVLFITNILKTVYANVKATNCFIKILKMKSGIHCLIFNNVSGNSYFHKI